MIGAALRFQGFRGTLDPRRATASIAAVLLAHIQRFHAPPGVVGTEAAQATRTAEVTLGGLDTTGEICSNIAGDIAWT